MLAADELRSLTNLRQNRDMTPTLIDHEYDWVIVGGGSAGSVLAARLSEDLNSTVLLLEAGPDWRSSDAAQEVRSLNPGLVIGKEKFAELQYPALKARRTTTQEPSLFWRGRGLGGSSTINGILAIRPIPEDHDGWGIPGWGWDDVLPYYRRLETDHDFGADPWHGSDGPLPIFRLPQDRWGAVDRAMSDASLDLGYGWCADHNAPTGSGVSPYALNGDPTREERVTTNDAYLEPARGRPNLTIIGDALVDRVVVQGSEAVGVRVRFDGEWTTVLAGEVILSAGAVHTPAILLRSGIGPTGTVAQLPVGQHLQDHPLCALIVPLRNDALPRTAFDRHTNVCVRYSSGLAGAGRNDMMLVGMNVTPMAPVGLLGAWVSECFSEGSLTLASDDPSVDPIVEEQMLSDERDSMRMRDGVRRLLEIGASASVSSIAAAEITGVIPLPRPDASDADIDDWALRTAGDAQHICSTARMGADGADDCVVDPQCRVRGVSRLRIVDASVLPRVPRANTHLTVLAVAEKAAAMLRG